MVIYVPLSLVFTTLTVSRGGGESLFPCSLPKLPHVSTPFPYLFPVYYICLPLIIALNFLPQKKKRKKTPKTKVIKEENRLYVTFSLCDTSSQAFQPNLQSFRVG